MSFFIPGFIPGGIKELNEDGNPIGTWDGSTFYELAGNDYTKAVASGSSEKYVTVVGAGSDYCIPLTLEEVCLLWWRVSRLRVQFDPSFAPAPILSVTNSGGGKYVDGVWTAGAVSEASIGSSSWTDKLNSSTQLIRDKTWTGTHSEFPEPSYDRDHRWISRSPFDNLVPMGGKIEERTDNLLGGEPIITYKSGPYNASLVFSALETQSDEENFPGNGASASWYFEAAITEMTPLPSGYFLAWYDSPTGRLRMYHNIAKSGDQYWLNPFQMGDRTNEFTTPRIHIHGEALAAKTVELDPPSPPFTMPNFATAAGDYDFTRAASSIGFSDLVFLTVEFHFLGRIKTGTTFLLKTGSEATEPGEGSAESDILPELPKLQVMAEKYFSWGGVYNEDTGEKV